MTVTVPMFGKIAANHARRQVENERKLKTMTATTEYPERGEALARILGELDGIATEFEATEIGNCVAVDFCLYELLFIEASSYDREVGDYSVEEYHRDMNIPPELRQQDREKLKRSKKERKSVGEIFRTGNDRATPTQRSGGSFKSSLILDESGRVVEACIRPPPILMEDATENDARRTIERVARLGIAEVERSHPEADGFSLESDVRPWVARRDRERWRIERGALEKRAAMVGPAAERILPPRQWCPHFYGKDSEFTPDVYITFIKYVVSNYNRFFPGAREWASSGADGLVWGGVEPALVALERVVMDYETHGDRGEGSVTFRLPGAERQSTIRVGPEAKYDLWLPVHPASEYGKILLPRAVEYVVETNGILVDARLSVETTDDGRVYHPRLESERPVPLAEVARDVVSLTENYATVRARSRLS